MQKRQNQQTIMFCDRILKNEVEAGTLIYFLTYHVTTARPSPTCTTDKRPFFETNTNYFLSILQFFFETNIFVGCPWKSI